MDTKDLEVRISKMGGITYWKENVLIGRRCTKCGQDKEINEFNFENKKKGIRHAKCKECNKQYYKTNKEHIKEKLGQWYKDNREHQKECSKQWYENNKDYRKKYDKQRREIMKEYNKEYGKRYRDEHKESAKKYMKQWYENNKNNNLMKITNILHQINPILKELEIKAYGYIYKITGINNHIYIGQTIKPLETRYETNIIQGWIKERKNKTNQKFLEEFENENNFTIDIIDYGICQYHLNVLEAHYIYEHDSYNNGYNNNAGHYKDDSGIEEFIQILEENNLEFIDNKIIKKRSHK